MLERINAFVWGMPALLAILGIGLYFTVRSKFAQFSLFGKAFRVFTNQFGKKNGKSQNSPYRSLCTALAATVGTGNIIGVAGAIVIGGPGSIFWMWLCGILGMVIKFAEATLAVRYRVKTAGGEILGGPMYMIKSGLGNKWSWLAGVYCILGVVASFGVGNAAQVNAVVESLGMVIKVDSINYRYLIGVVIGFLVALVLIGGAKRIGAIAETVVPMAACGYILFCLAVLIMRAHFVPQAFEMIFVGAFEPKAVTGGVLGSAFQALMIGASRGTFTNEAGMGTAAIAHGGADVNHPVEQGLMGLWEVFLDTILICTMTALVILSSGVKVPYGAEHGATLTVDAFAAVLGEWVKFPLTIIVCAFGIATIFGWSFYGIRCTQYLFGARSWKLYAFVQVVVVAVSALIKTEKIWTFSELMNGLMLLPNLVALVWLSPECIRLIYDYKNRNNYSRQT